mmetsp:Transcript_5706/g.8767  ORF Transcript_5706/g.8767 Transcript_5706/m.8767 type:complete len:140 (+) Transcript_5706:159-578(+)
MPLVKKRTGPNDTSAMASGFREHFPSPHIEQPPSGTCGQSSKYVGARLVDESKPKDGNNEGCCELIGEKEGCKDGNRDGRCELEGRKDGCKDGNLDGRCKKVGKQEGRKDGNYDGHCELVGASEEEGNREKNGVLEVEG